MIGVAKCDTLSGNQKPKYGKKRTAHQSLRQHVGR